MDETNGIKQMLEFESRGATRWESSVYVHLAESTELPLRSLELQPLTPCIVARHAWAKEMIGG